jgi:WhiB family redox-sensing transcriptional regulator
MSPALHVVVAIAPNVTVETDSADDMRRHYCCATEPSLASAAVTSTVGWATLKAPWTERAVCRNAVAGLFYPVADETPSARRTRESVAVLLCASRPVSAQCREHALRTNEKLGVWGGLTERERRNS